jgi:hypothetical protein
MDQVAKEGNMLIRISLVGAAVALGITAAGAHQSYNIERGQMNVAAAEKLLLNYLGTAGRIPMLFPNSSTTGQDANKVATPGERLRCALCHFG